MVQAQGSRHSMSYVAESTFGTTPSTPSMIEIRNTGTTLKVNKDNFVSDEIRNDRQITDLRHGLKQINGDVNFELSYGAFDDLLEGALFGTWATNVLKAGVTEKFFSIERAFADITQYEVFTGCMVNSMSLSITPNAMVTGTFGLIGKDGTISATPLDAAITPAASHPPFDGFTGSLNEGGGAVNNVTSLTLDLQNNLTPSFVVGANTTPRILAGRSVVTGTLTAFFENETLLNKFLNETVSSLSLTLTGAAGGDLTIAIPSIKYTAAENDVTSADDGVILNMPFQAVRDDTLETNIQLTRTPA